MCTRRLWCFLTELCCCDATLEKPPDNRSGDINSETPAHCFLMWLQPVINQAAPWCSSPAEITPLKPWGGLLSGCRHDQTVFRRRQADSASARDSLGPWVLIRSLLVAADELFAWLLWPMYKMVHSLRDCLPEKQ